MSHLSDQSLLLLRDGLDGADAEAVAHLADCAACRSALEEARARHRRVRAALEATDASFDLDDARARVRSRLGSEAARDEPQVTALPVRALRVAGVPLGRAAAVLVLVAAGASALPWSPVRSWLSGRGGAEPTPAGAPAEALGVAAAAADPRAGVRTAVGDGPLTVEITGVTPGSEVVVRWVPGSEVALFGPAGSRFASSPGRVEAAVASGSVEVELPQDVRPASIRVDGRMILRSSAAGLELPGPVAERSDTRIVFRIEEG